MAKYEVLSKLIGGVIGHFVLVGIYGWMFQIVFPSFSNWQAFAIAFLFAAHTAQMSRIGDKIANAT